MFKPVVSTSTLRKQSGAAILWMMPWLAGIVAITYVCLIKHLPALELATEERINTALAATTARSVFASVNGYSATLIGTAKNEYDKNKWLTLAAATPGVREVVDQIEIEGAIADAPAVAKADNTTPLIAPEATSQESQAANSTETDAEPTVAQPSSSPAQPGPATPTEQDTPASTDADPAPTSTEQATASPGQEAVELPTPIQAPTLDIEIVDGTLMLAGRVANPEAINTLVEQAKATLGVDFVIDSVEINANTAPADWLEPLTALLPAMSSLGSPAFDVNKNQVTLSGDAPSQQAHDDVINRALSLLGDYSLVEHINVVPTPEPQEQPAEKTGPAKTADTKTDQTTDVTQISESTFATENTSSAEPPAATTQTAIPDTRKTETGNTETDSTSTENKVNAKAPADEPQTIADVKAAQDNKYPSVAARTAFEALPSKRILFKSSSTILTTESKQVLNKIAEILNKHPDTKMDINGHTDASGKAEINLILSQERANAVRDYLVSQGISVYRLTAYGYGEGLPIAPNNTPEGRALNRRIDFKF